MSTTYSFTKVIVDDLEKMAGFYSQVYGLKEIERIQAAIGSDAVDEIMIGEGDEFAGGLILLKFLDRSPPANGEVILGFITDNVEGVYERVLAAGGGIHAPIKHDPGAPYKVGFARDPEGHLAEIVERVG